MPENNDQVWKLPRVVEKYLSGTRLAFPGAVQQIEIMLKLITENALSVNKVLDIGCGDGLLGAAILEQYPTASGVFLDFSEEMLQAAQTKLSSFGNRIEVINTDYGERNWVERMGRFAPFDVIVSGYSIHHQPDERKKEIYAEIYSFLCSGGIFINVEHVLSRSEWVGHVHNEYFIDALHQHHLGIVL